MNRPWSVTETCSIRPWRNSAPPKRVLIVRFQAIGDVAVTLPSCSGLRELLPEANIDFLTLEGNEGIPEACGLFDHVFTLRAGRSATSRLTGAVSSISNLRSERYDIIIDLQRNWLSRFIRDALAPLSWSEFDRFSPANAYTRTLETFHAVGFPGMVLRQRMPGNNGYEHTRSFLERHGWCADLKTVLMNPAGLWQSRNWPIERYADLAHLLAIGEPIQLMFLGTDRLGSKVSSFTRPKNIPIIDLTGKASLSEACSALQFVDLMVTEDSGLMHIACSFGVPIVALFGSSRQDWSAPIGPNSICLHSGDLECGACMAESCRFGDTHCLTRYSPEFVFERCRELLNRASEKARAI